MLQEFAVGVLLKQSYKLMTIKDVYKLYKSFQEERGKACSKQIQVTKELKRSLHFTFRVGGGGAFVLHLGTREEVNSHVCTAEIDSI